MSSIEKWLSLSKGEGKFLDLKSPDPDWALGGEGLHTAVGGIVSLVTKRNPYVFVATGLSHAGYHLLSKYLDSGSSAQSYQQYGGPETFSNYKASRNSRTVAARSVIRTGGRRSGSKPRGPKGTLIKCPKGYYWDKKTGRCLRNRKY